ncbi:hypothetical protein ECC02_008059 [Trypanosoma cruzi]|uniref:Uncharacterized protein n=1 Tax=Trypanosoma cruzi TaxID=5693 RepID=A0A7J6XX41_TRYCR|nr:hypothetical protein ECC02_008059 [Trypanosoma cruzi]
MFFLFDILCVCVFARPGEGREAILERHVSCVEMSRLVVHKESLPAQVGIKRRRTPAVAPASPTAVGREKDVGKKTFPATDDADGNTTDNNRREPEETNDGEADRAHPVDSVSEGEEESSEDEEMMELERERRRIEQLHQEKQRTKDEKTCGGSAAAAPPVQATRAGNNNNNNGNSTTVGGVSSYNHDVLFRRREWREQNIVTAADGAKDSKKARWEAVHNSAQRSAAFRHFMKNHFK